MRLTSLNQLIHRDKIFEGHWRIRQGARIEYTRRGKEEQAVLSGEILAAKPTGFKVRVTQQQIDQRITRRTLTLNGRWQADSNNRLTFLVKRQKGTFDRLILEGAWQLSRRNELTVRTRRSGRQTDQRQITFKGHWDILERRRLTYVLDLKKGSAFRFRGTFQTPSVLAKRGEIRYQLGVEVHGRKQVRTVVLFGKWKLSRDLGFSFEVPYSKGISKTIQFQSSYTLTRTGRVTATLKTRSGKPIGFEVIVSQSFLRGKSEAFVRLRRNLREQAVEAGVRIRW